jgi:hypothetical protein
VPWVPEVLVLMVLSTRVPRVRAYGALGACT